MNSTFYFFESSAVIAPAVPMVLHVLVPMLLFALYMLLTTVPRWLLLFAYWLWHRIAPKSLLDRRIPGIRSRVFQGVAVRGFTDEYEFSVPVQDDVATRIRNFFVRCGARSEEDARLVFSRGNRLCTCFLSHLVPWRERDFLQNITVKISRTFKGQMDIRVRYAVQAFCMLRLQPAGLQSEAARLYRELQAAP